MIARDPNRRACLEAKALDRRLVFCERRVQQFQCQAFTGVGVLDLVHRAHTAASDDANDFVAVIDDDADAKRDHVDVAGVLGRRSRRCGGRWWLRRLWNVSTAGRALPARSNGMGGDDLNGHGLHGRRRVGQIFCSCRWWWRLPSPRRRVG